MIMSSARRHGYALSEVLYFWFIDTIRGAGAALAVQAIKLEMRCPQPHCIGLTGFRQW